jgi:hypothetical protein
VPIPHNPTSRPRPRRSLPWPPGFAARVRRRIRHLPLLSLFLGVLSPSTAADLPPTLPLTGDRIVRVATEPELQSAMSDLRPGDTVLLADGTYALTASLYVNQRNNVTIRGTSGSSNVVLQARGMDNPNHGGVLFGLWSNSTNTTLAHLTIRDTYDNAVIFNAGAQSPRLYSVQLLNAGSQFIKANSTDATHGVDDGRVESCRIEYLADPPTTDHGAGVGYFNGISAHAARRWTLRGNLFKNLHNPDSADYPWNPAVLMWRRSSDTVVEGNTFINVDRAVAFGLENSSAPDHSGGAIRNNFVYLEPGLMTPARTASSDATILAWNSPGTTIDHNTVLLNGNVTFAIQFRFPQTREGAARHNLADAPVHLRDNATALLAHNRSNARPEWFIAPDQGDLHLRPTVTDAIDQVPALEEVPTDFDGHSRPHGAKADLGADEWVPPPRPRISSAELHEPHFTVAIDASAGNTYYLEHTDNLQADAWSSLDPSFALADGLMALTHSNTLPQSPRFYRVRLDQ